MARAGVRRVRIEVMDPHQRGCAARLRQVGFSARSVVSFEPARLPPRAADRRTRRSRARARSVRQHERRDERRGAISGAFEALGGDRVRWPPGIARSRGRRDRRGRARSSSSYATAASPEPWHRRAGTLAPGGERIEGRCIDTFRLRPDGISARRVEGDEENRGPRLARRVAVRGLASAPAGEEHRT